MSRVSVLVLVVVLLLVAGCKFEEFTAGKNGMYQPVPAAQTGRVVSQTPVADSARLAR